MGQPAAVVGRDRQLAALRHALDEARRGNGRLVLLAGEPGIGKSTLVEAFCDEARARGATVLWAAGWDGGGAPAYWPWIQVLRAAPEPGRSMMAALGLDLSGPAGLQIDRFSLFDAVTQVLQAVAEPGPLVVALDDLHVAGVASVLLLAFVARHTRRSPVVLVGTYRDVEVRLDAELAPVMRDLESVALPLNLLPFDRAQVEQALAGSVPDLTDEFVAEVLER